mmetsp:Transcript_24299/g.38258  ORF Transcript_24299/g.38258 Transcript_24299/m.38258 type:complete len:242 (-) Transcript_24299:2306-3031(-)
MPVGIVFITDVFVTFPYFLFLLLHRAIPATITTNRSVPPMIAASIIVDIPDLEPPEDSEVLSGSTSSGADISATDSPSLWLRVDLSALERSVAICPLDLVPTAWVNTASTMTDPATNTRIKSFSEMPRNCAMRVLILAFKASVISASILSLKVSLTIHLLLRVGALAGGFVGKAVGIAVGFGTGARVGAGLGTPVGRSVGNGVGSGVGVATVVGNLVGFGTGGTGSGVGKADGNSVGNSVG